MVGQALSPLVQDSSRIALQQLAGLARATRSDLGTLPERALAEMGVKPMDRDVAIDFLVARGGLVRSGPFQSLLRAFPALSDRWRKHLEYWGGEPAGDHNEVAEVVHFVVEDLCGKGNLGDVRKIFEFMNGNSKRVIRKPSL